LKAIDLHIPGTNVSYDSDHRQALIFITVVEVEMATLVAMIAASVVNWLGAGFVAGLPRRAIRLAMGAPVVAAGFMLMRM
jgi:hypothetical protein